MNIFVSEKKNLGVRCTLRSLEEVFSENSVKFSDCRVFSLFKTVPGCRAFRHFVVKNSCSANYRCMTHDIYFVKTRTNKQKETRKLESDRIGPDWITDRITESKKKKLKNIKSFMS